MAGVTSTRRPATLTPPADPDRPARWPRWITVLVGGTILWGAAIGAFALTGDRYLSAAIVLGTFVVPSALAARWVDGADLPGVDRRLMVRLFIAGGLLGFVVSAAIESPLTGQPAAAFDGLVGSIEEIAKLVVLAVMARHVAPKTGRSGFVLGGLVGLGFSAFESAGYVLVGMLAGNTTPSIVGTLATRAAITPFTHVLWSGIAGAALFATSRDGHLRVTPLGLAALFGVIVLHAGWDVMPNLVSNLQTSLAGPTVGGGRHLSSELLDDAGLTVLSLPAVYIALRIRRRTPPGTHRRLGQASTTAVTSGIAGRPSPPGCTGSGTVGLGSGPVRPLPTDRSSCHSRGGCPGGA